MTEPVRAADVPDDGIGELLTRAFADVQQVARAEIALQSARALAKVRAARTAAVLLVAAVFAASLATTAMVVGALLILQRVVGPAWATVIVVGTLLLAAGACGWSAMARFKALFGATKDSL